MSEAKHTCPTCGTFPVDAAMHKVVDRRRNMADAIMDVVIPQLHYFDKIKTTDLYTCTYADLMRITEGAVDRYLNDPEFHSRVDSMVCALMRGLERQIEQEVKESGARIAGHCG